MLELGSVDRSQTLAQRAGAVLRDAIRDGRLHHGDVYSEAGLAESMAISRTPVREALIELSRAGIVEILPQRGFRLRSLTAAERSEVFDLRLALELPVVERLAREFDPAQGRELERMLKHQRASVRTPSRLLELDEAFHLSLPAFLGLERTRLMLEQLRGAMWLMGTAALSRRDRGDAVLAEHGAVVDAIAVRDPREARAAMKQHLDETRRTVELELRP